MEALCSMKAGKAGGLNEITSDFLTLCGEESVKRLNDVANGLLDGKKVKFYLYIKEREMPSVVTATEVLNCWNKG